MSNEIRVRQNFLKGVVSNSPLAVGGTTLTSAGLTTMQAVSATQHLPLVLDPDGLFGNPEIVYVTAHASGANSATIQRAMEGTTARQHVQNTPWIHGGLVSDVEPSGWIAATLQNSWTDLGLGYTPTGYLLEPSGFVVLRGTLAPGFSGVRTIFTLPVGYRPEFDSRFPATSYTSGTYSVPNTVVVRSSGIVSADGDFSGLNNYAIDGVRFRRVA